MGRHSPGGGGGSERARAARSPQPAARSPQPAARSPQPAAAADAASAAASAASAAAPLRLDAIDAGGGQTVLLNIRPIVTFHVNLLGRTPHQRAALAQVALGAALERDGPGCVTFWLDG